MDDRCVLLFVKYPEEGKVKKRLQAGLKDVNIVALYQKFVLDILLTLEKLNTKLYICFSPENSEAKFIKWLGNKYSYIPQKGIDLGARMKNCFIEAFSRKYKRVIIVGSDTPDLPCEYIENTFSGLESNDVVIGPATDGGYYLLGFRFDKFVPEIFEGIEWSTDKVFKDTLAILDRSKKKTCILPEWNDIDVHEDLINFIKRNKCLGKSSTYSFLLNCNSLQTYFLEENG